MALMEVSVKLMLREQEQARSTSTSSASRDDIVARRWFEMLRKYVLSVLINKNIYFR